MEANLSPQAGLVTSHGWVPVTLVFDMSRLRLDESAPPSLHSATAQVPAPVNLRQSPLATDSPIGPLGPLAQSLGHSERADEPTTVLHGNDSPHQGAADTHSRNLGADGAAPERANVVPPPPKPLTPKQQVVCDAAALVAKLTSKEDAEKARAALDFIQEHRALLGDSFGYESDAEPDTPSEDWHVVTRGLKTGLFHTSVRTNPLVDGVKRNVHQAAGSKGQAAVKYLSALAYNGVLQLA